LDITNENNIYENDEVINIIGSINSLENEQYAVNGTGNELEGPPIGGGGTTNDGSSFSSAIQIMPGYTISGEFENGQERKYYKFQGMPVNNYYLATINNIYDQTNTNVGVYLYNSLNDLLDYDIDSNFGNLFKLDTSISGGEYFVMIELQSLSPTPSYQFKIEFDSTCNCINAPENLAFNQNSVQNGEILFVNESQYNSEINYAVSLWNQEEIVNISEDSNGFVLVEDAYLGSEGLVARAIQFFGIFTSKIQLNSYYYETMNFYERVKTITHEFGHLLGMDEFNGDYLISTETVTNAMVQGIRELYELGPCDKLMFRYLH